MVKGWWKVWWASIFFFVIGVYLGINEPTRIFGVWLWGILAFIGTIILSPEVQGYESVYCYIFLFIWIILFVMWYVVSEIKEKKLSSKE